MLIGAVRLVVAYIEFETVNTLSRRFMLLTSAWTMFISLVIMGVILLCPIPEKIQGGIAAAFLLIFCCGFAFGMGSGKQTTLFPFFLSLIDLVHSVWMYGPLTPLY